jgi:hypothetical protein
VHVDWRKRYFTGTKQELIVGCLKSLVNSIKHCTHEVNLVVMDDHSSEDTLSKIKDICSSVKSEVISLEGTGYNNSNYQQWVRCRDTDADLFYSIEDDYLHVPSAIQEMVDTYILSKEKLNGKEVVLYPFDTPEEYRPPNSMAFIVHGSNRHWRTGLFSTCVLMTSPQILKDNWELFETLALKYNGDYLHPRTEHYEESNTIWKVWNNGNAIRLNPIPSLALHMQFIEQLDPFIDWTEWWDQYAT